MPSSALARLTSVMYPQSRNRSHRSSSVACGCRLPTNTRHLSTASAAGGAACARSRGASRGSRKGKIGTPCARSPSTADAASAALENCAMHRPEGRPSGESSPRSAWTRPYGARSCSSAEAARVEGEGGSSSASTLCVKSHGGRRSNETYAEPADSSASARSCTTRGAVAASAGRGSSGGHSSERTDGRSFWRDEAIRCVNSVESTVWCG
mmetsp:Transcript_32133/g.80033  ORF Transcript_32133/g.80033 Transcript_32133/m.80033 type:complete len:210 (-) Transcript_32133:206-835(-)